MSAESQSADHYDNTPGAREEGTASGQTVEQYFKGLLEEYREEITAMLTAGLTWSRFMNSCLAAMRRDPSFLEGTTRRSVITSLIQSAQDGLVPDGKEGVITPYKNKRSGKREAKWNPMTQGLRKRARELDGLLIDAQVVHEKDTYRRTQGDEPKIVHEPADHLPDRGPMILTYAIFKREDGTILHREVMNKAQVMEVKGQSSQPDSLMWTKFETEGWRKSVIRRGFKTVPVSDALMRVVSREDDNFDFSHERESAAIPAAPPAPPPAPKPPQVENKPAIVLDIPPAKTAETVSAPEGVTIIRHDTNKADNDQVYRDWMEEVLHELDGCENEADVDALRLRTIADLRPEDIQAFKNRCAEKASTLFSG
jgi:recombination protein RecT